MSRLNNISRSIKRNLFGTKKSPLIAKLKNNSEKQTQIEFEVEELVKSQTNISKIDLYRFLTNIRKIKQKNPYFKSRHWKNLKIDSNIKGSTGSSSGSPRKSSSGSTRKSSYKKRPLHLNHSFTPGAARSMYLSHMKLPKKK